MTIPKNIQDLIEHFEYNQDQYMQPNYNETQTRREFIDPFFMALGWDIMNEQRFAEAYKDVVHEDAIKVGGATKAPDYSFRIGGNRKFFVEAKKPSVKLLHDAEAAFQLRRYGWSAKLSLSILTNFAEFAVYDCRFKPNRLADKASKARILYMTFDEYATRWHEIADVFSRHAILKGGFDKFAKSNKSKRGTAEVDVAFLEEIEAWRMELARNIALRNPMLDEGMLNFAVQRTIDRIVFLRICEDRGIEDYGRLMALQNGNDVYERLMQLCRQADTRYNSGLFHFRHEPNRPDVSIDTVTLELVVDDSLLKKIFKNLYYPESPYEFSILPADILGQVYEQFLGKVIRLTKGHRAKVEEKPEVKKAGGVYYTPTYIVDYIVKQTVGKLVHDKSPTEIAHVKILDPACGSGTFLLQAYQFLLDWYLDYYISHEPEKWAKKKKPPIRETATTPSPSTIGRGESAPIPSSSSEWRGASSDSTLLVGEGQGVWSWQLTIHERKRILLNHMHGVDIDRQAVEVTKLSLLLKVLEGENEASLQPILVHERALPDLSDNIKCGNSLVGWDVMEVLGIRIQDSGVREDSDLSGFEKPDRSNEVRSLNPFDWHTEFSGIMQAGGFDVVMGNPPYVRQELFGNLKNYLKKNYQVYHGTADLYSYFIEKGITLLKNEGVFGVIVANKWLRANYGKSLRQWLKTKTIMKIIDFGDLPIFPQATTYPCILTVNNTDLSPDNMLVSQVDTLEFDNLQEYVQSNHYHVTRDNLRNGWSLAKNKSQDVLDKMQNIGMPLGEYVQDKIYRGILTGLNKAFVIDEATRAMLIAEDESSAEIIKPFLAGRDVKRYQPLQSKKYVILIPKGWTRKKSKNTRYAWQWFKKNYTAVASHLEPFAKKAKKRHDQGEYWWELRTCTYYEEFEKQKIIWPNLCDAPRFTYDDKNFYVCAPANILSAEKGLFILGILNSNIVGWFMKLIAAGRAGGFFEYKPIYVNKIPIRIINFDDPAEVAMHDRMAALAESMLDLHARLTVTQLPHEKTLLQRQIAATDKQIDMLVYRLYDLTDDEIKIVQAVQL